MNVAGPSILQYLGTSLVDPPTCPQHPEEAAPGPDCPVCTVSELVPLHRIVGEDTAGPVAPPVTPIRVGSSTVRTKSPGTASRSLPRREGAALASGVIRSVKRRADYVAELQSNAYELLEGGSLSEALKSAILSIHYITKYFGVDDDRLPMSMLTIAQAYLRSDHVKKGLQYLEATARFVDEHPALIKTAAGADVAATCFNEFGSLHYRAGNYDEAERYFGCQYTVMQGAGADCTDCYVRLGLTKQMLAHYQPATEFFGRALAGFQRRFGVDDRRAVSMLFHLGNVSLLAGKPHKALQHYTECYAVYCRVGDNVGVANAALSMSIALRILGRTQDARTTATRALCLRQERFGMRHPEVARCILALGEAELATGCHSEALRLLSMAATLLKPSESLSATRSLSPDQKVEAVTYADAVGGVGAAQAALGMPTEAFVLAGSLARTAIGADSLKSVFWLGQATDVLLSLGNQEAAAVQFGELLRLLGDGLPPSADVVLGTSATDLMWDQVFVTDGTVLQARLHHVLPHPSSPIGCVHGSHSRVDATALDASIDGTAVLSKSFVWGDVVSRFETALASVTSPLAAAGESSVVESPPPMAASVTGVLSPPSVGLASPPPPPADSPHWLHVLSTPPSGAAPSPIKSCLRDPSKPKGDETRVRWDPQWLAEESPSASLHLADLVAEVSTPEPAPSSPKVVHEPPSLLAVHDFPVQPAMEIANTHNNMVVSRGLLRSRLLFGLGVALRARIDRTGGAGAALDCFTACLNGRVAALGPNAPSTAEVHSELGGILLQRGALRDARHHLTQAHAIRRRHWGPAAPETVDCVRVLGQLYMAEGRHRQAVAAFTAVADAGGDPEDVAAAKRLVAAALRAARSSRRA